MSTPAHCTFDSYNVRCVRPADYRMTNDHGEAYACREHLALIVAALCEEGDTVVELLPDEA